MNSPVYTLFNELLFPVEMYLLIDVVNDIVNVWMYNKNTIRE